jgi:hypothetical protein
MHLQYLEADTKILQHELLRVLCHTYPLAVNLLAELLGCTLYTMEHTSAISTLDYFILTNILESSFLNIIIPEIQAHVERMNTFTATPCTGPNMLD